MDAALDDRLAEASSLADQGDWPAAFEMLLEAEPDHPDDPTLLCMLGVAARENGASGAAYDFFRRCLAHDPEDPTLLALAGEGIAASDDPDAERVLRLAAMTAPALVITRLKYGAYLSREGLFEQAITELEAARDLAPDEPGVRFELGIAYLLAERMDAALDELEGSVARDPDDDWMQALYGLALAVAGRGEEAAEQLVPASQVREDDWEIQVAAALASAAAGWDDEAWAALARAELVPGADAALVREVEEGVESGAEASGRLLRDEVAAPLLRVRILSRD